VGARPYQSALIYEITKLFNRGHKRLIVQLPTGGGKTMIASELVRRAQCRRLLYIVPSDEILEQTSEALARVGMSHAVLSAGKQFSLDGVTCLLAMSQTLRRRLHAPMFTKWAPDLIFVDEAHKLIDQHRRVLDRWPCPVIGLTATPVRLDGQSLAALWPVLLCGPSIKSLQRQGFLVPCRTVNAYMPDLSAIKHRGADYDADDLDRAYSDDSVIEAAPAWWLEIAKGKRTIAFTPGVQSSRRLVEAYRRKGIRAEHVDGTTPKADRKAALDRLRRQQIDVLFNCALFVEGLDVIEVECIQLLTSTESLSKFMQAVGRGLRPARGKRELILIDHGGNSSRHDCVDADRDWYNGGQSLDRSKKTCLCCGTIIAEQSNLCPSCFRDPALAAKPSPMAEARAERAQSKATPPRPCPAWAVRVRDEWVRMEQARHAQGLPLSETERYCRRLLRSVA
jgi:superfamily II DNA or RNA helicase